MDTSKKYDQICKTPLPLEANEAEVWFMDITSSMIQQYFEIPKMESLMISLDILEKLKTQNIILKEKK